MMLAISRTSQHPRIILLLAPYQVLLKCPQSLVSRPVEQQVSVCYLCTLLFYLRNGAMHGITSY